jgi:outer membrane protein TolC
MIINFSFAIDLNDIVQMAKERATKVKLSKLDLQKLDQQVKELKGNIYPTITASGQYVRWDKNYVFGFTPLNQYNFSINLNQNLFDYTVIESLKYAKKNKELQRFVIEDITNSIVETAKNMYLDVLLKKEAVNVKRENLNYWKNYLDFVKEKYEVGIVPKIDFVNAKSKYYLAKAQLKQAEAEYTTAIQSLKRLLLIEDKIEIEDRLEYSKVEIPEIPENLENINTTLKLYLKKLEVADQFIYVQKADAYPKLTFQASYLYNNYVKFPAKEEAYRGGYQLALKADWKIYDGNKRKAKIMQAKIDKAKEEQTFKDKLLEIKTDIQTTLENIDAVKSEIEAMEENLKASKENLDLATERYKAGIGNQLEVENAENSYQQAKFNYLSSIYKYYRYINHLYSLLNQN